MRDDVFMDRPPCLWDFCDSSPDRLGQGLFSELCTDVVGPLVGVPAANRFQLSCSKAFREGAAFRDREGMIGGDSSPETSRVPGSSYYLHA